MSQKLWEQIPREIHLKGEDYTFITDDVANALFKLIEAKKKFKCIITSPPYYGARSYLEKDDPAKKFEIGTEDTPNEYVDKMISTIKLMWDVLSDDGILYFNVADVYDDRGSLMLIPQRLQVRMEDELGYIMRNTLIWRKPNPRPEGAQGRFPVSYEFVFYAVKSKKYKFYDQNIRVPLKSVTKKRYQYPVGGFSSAQGGVNSRNSTEYVDLSEDTGIAFGGHKYNKDNSNGLYSQKTWKPSKDGKTKIKDNFEISATAFYNKEYCPTCDVLRTKKEIWFECKKCQHRFNKVDPSELAKINGLDPNAKCDICDRSWKRHFSPNSRDRVKGINSTVIICGGKSVNIPRKMSGCPSCGHDKRMIICRVCNKEVHSHYAMFPEKLVEMLMVSATEEGDECLDPFSGFGTVISVATRLKRKATGIDINPLNTAMAYRRAESVLQKGDE